MLSRFVILGMIWHLSEFIIVFLFLSLLRREWYTYWIHIKLMLRITNLGQHCSKQNTNIFHKYFNILFSYILFLLNIFIKFNSTFNWHFVVSKQFYLRILQIAHLFQQYTFEENFKSSCAILSRENGELANSSINRMCYMHP